MPCLLDSSCSTCFQHPEDGGPPEMDEERSSWGSFSSVFADSIAETIAGLHLADDTVISSCRCSSGLSQGSIIIASFASNLAKRAAAGQVILGTEGEEIKTSSPVSSHSAVTAVRPAALPALLELAVAVAEPAVATVPAGPAEMQLAPPAAQINLHRPSVDLGQVDQADDGSCVLDGTLEYGLQKLPSGDDDELVQHLARFVCEASLLEHSMTAFLPSQVGLRNIIFMCLVIRNTGKSEICLPFAFEVWVPGTAAMYKLLR